MTSEAMISCSNIWGWKTRPYLVIINVKALATSQSLCLTRLELNLEFSDQEH